MNKKPPLNRAAFVAQEQTYAAVSSAAGAWNGSS